MSVSGLLVVGGSVSHPRSVQYLCLLHQERKQERGAAGPTTQQKTTQENPGTV